MAKMGRPKKIKTPEEMWEHFQRYVEQEKKNPIKKMDFKGKDAEEVTYKLERPLSKEGFYIFLYKEGITCGGEHYFRNLNNGYTDFLGVCSLIKRIIRKDQIDGGMAGIYNPSITQRLNNLSERTENKNVNETKLDLELDTSKLSTDAIKELLNAIKSTNDEPS